MTRLRIRMLRDVVSELPLCIEAPVIAERGHEYAAMRYAGGAVVATLPDGERLGVKPGEFEEANRE